MCADSGYYGQDSWRRSEALPACHHTSLLHQSTEDHTYRRKVCSPWGGLCSRCYPRDFVSKKKKSIVHIPQYIIRYIWFKFSYIKSLHVTTVSILQARRFPGILGGYCLCTVLIMHITGPCVYVYVCRRVPSKGIAYAELSTIPVKQGEVGLVVTFTSEQLIDVIGAINTQVQ